MLELACARRGDLQNFRFGFADAGSLPLDDESFDAARRRPRIARYAAWGPAMTRRSRPCALAW